MVVESLPTQGSRAAHAQGMLIAQQNRISVGKPTLMDIADRLFAASQDIRYVALLRDGEPLLRARPELDGASSSDSDRYEELLVNPTLLVLTRQRGDIDCGGLEYIVIRYGNFFQLVHPVEGGHISVAIEPRGDPQAVLELVRDAIRVAGIDEAAS